MQYINPKQKHIVDALQKHVDSLLPDLKSKINNCEIVEIKEFLIPNIKNLLKSNPEDLSEIQELFYTDNPDFKIYLEDKQKRVHYDKNIRNKYEPYLKEIKRIINYDKFINKENEKNTYDAYNLADNLKINTCTYCNRLYTKTVINKPKNGKIKKLTRPTFDHWFPQSKNPLLALSFFNLIPSCNVCNSSLKNSAPLSLDKFLHPYINEQINFQFSYKLISVNEREFNITYFDDDIDTKSKNTARFFKLKEIYKTHIDEIDDLLKIKNAYSTNYLNNMRVFFQNSSGLSNEEIYRLAFGTEIDETCFEKRPLSRMKRDILIELGIIRNDD